MRKDSTKRKIKTRAEPNNMLIQFLEGDSISIQGYTKLSNNPEFMTAIERISDLVASMTIHLMENKDDGDVRIKNELSRKVDISPYSLTTGYNFKKWIVKNMILNGNAFVFPKINNSNGLLEDLIPLPNGNIIPSNFGYNVRYQNTAFRHDEILHFVLNPKENKIYEGQGYSLILKDVVKNLKQASKTTNEFMSNKVMPSLIVKVDSITAELASEEGRDGIYDSFLKDAKQGKPWIIPAELLDVEQVKPLTLNDIAIKDTIILDKKTVASIVGIPAFLVGVGDFNEVEYNNFIRTTIMSIAKNIEQELTKKLLISPDMYWKFNSRSLFSYSLKEMAEVGSNLYVKGIMTGNEVRDWIGLSPIKNLSELVILENYIPLDKISEQNKLGGE